MFLIRAAVLATGPGALAHSYVGILITDITRCLHGLPLGGHFALLRLICQFKVSNIRLLFAESQVFGRMGKQAFQTIADVGLDDKDVSGLSHQLIYSLNWMHDRVLHAPPRCVEVKYRPTFFIFLDGALHHKVA